MREMLRKYFGYASFQPLQEEIITDVLKSHDVLVLMPTGGGKSLCYQLPAVIKDGITVVISPLISLMKDQVDSLRSIGISAASINSTLDYDTVREIKSGLTRNHIKLLYVAPERIVLPDFFNFLHQLNVNLIAIDEAHCISEWGHDFRPEYRKLNLLKENFPKVPLIALTSTAVPQVQSDIIKQLSMVSPGIYRASLNRKNLFYRTIPTKKEMYQRILRYIRNHPNDSGIIYCHSRKSAEELSARLQADGVRALPYHAGLSAKVRTQNQAKFINEDVEVIAATIAFGMGIDKSNVRYIIHCDMPKSIEGYYQETGRAGRDGARGDCVLFFSYADKIKHEYFIKQIEDEQYRKVAYRQMHDMIDFCTGESCRRKILLNYFGEKYDLQNCNMCDVCAPSVERETTPYRKQELAARQPAKTVRTNYLDTEYDRNLFEILRGLRRGIAGIEEVPPYIVFSDATLKEMSTRYPQDLARFKRINGVGEVKLKKYGRLFVEKIVDYCRSNGIRTKIVSSGVAPDYQEAKSYSVAEIRKKYPSAYEKWTKGEERKLVSEYGNGKTIKELSGIFGRQRAAIRAKLRKLNIIP